MGSIVEDQNLLSGEQLNEVQQAAYVRTFSVGTAGRDAGFASLIDRWDHGRKYPNVPTELVNIYSQLNGQAAPEESGADHQPLPDFFGVADKANNAGLKAPDIESFKTKTNATAN